MGEGPLYSFFIPYHLVHFEVPNAIGRVVLFRDSIAPPLAGPVVEVCAIAKRDLKAGDEMSKQQYLPEGLVEGCKLRRDIKRDAVLAYSDVDLPPNRLADRLRAEQYRHFRSERWLEDLVNVPV
jgi:predicted homoserine dehydrogenase-like protein